ncbi:hypothetical protein D9757_006113 [Collybiopsis confluens]|uniref:Uncharacterized protein n=1 Tax=Collybiopsis confluens TaxID=2823264 RepID=A0A8H5HIA9_9AGAR|nr:hypothetical protein D9757_006113 [Collybiopsis confluens]
MPLQSLTLDQLNNDILYTILLIIHDVSRHSLFYLLRANRKLHEVTLPILLSSCVLDYTTGDQQKASIARVESWLKQGNDSTVLSFMRHLTVKATRPYYYREKGEQKAPDTSKWDPLVQLLMCIPHLASFTFDCHEQMPTVLLSRLGTYQPTAHLHIRNWTRISNDTLFGDPAEEALANSPSLRSLHGFFVTGQVPEADYRFPAFNRIVKLAPNLESVSQTTLSGGGCVVYGYSREEQTIRSREAKKFEAAVPRRKVIKSLEMNYGNAYTLEELATYIELNQLVSLKNIQLTSDFLLLAAENSTYKLSSLKHLDVKLYSARRGWAGASVDLADAFVQFLASLGPLESLSIVLSTSQPWSSILSAICHHHGSSLTGLSLHQVESADKESMRACLTLEEVEDISNSCPGLTNLELDIDRTISRKQEQSYYAVLRLFANLRKLTIHMDLGLVHYSGRQNLLFRRLEGNLSDDDPDAVQLRLAKKCYAHADEAFALDVWRDVAQSASPANLQKLVLCMGEQNREIGHGYPARWVLQEQSDRHLVRVQRNERDDQLEHLDVKITPEPRRSRPIAVPSKGLSC